MGEQKIGILQVSALLCTATCGASSMDFVFDLLRLGLTPVGFATP